LVDGTKPWIDELTPLRTAKERKTLLISSKYNPNLELAVNHFVSTFVQNYSNPVVVTVTKATQQAGHHRKRLSAGAF
jgi:hypothetical protein